HRAAESLASLANLRGDGADLVGGRAAPAEGVKQLPQPIRELAFREIGLRRFGVPGASKRHRIRIGHDVSLVPTAGFERAQCTASGRLRGPPKLWPPTRSPQAAPEGAIPRVV